jgi:hypothetical protein
MSKFIDDHFKIIHVTLPKRNHTVNTHPTAVYWEQFKPIPGTEYLHGYRFTGWGPHQADEPRHVEVYRVEAGRWTTGIMSGEFLVRLIEVGSFATCKAAAVKYVAENCEI